LLLAFPSAEQQGQHAEDELVGERDQVRNQQVEQKQTRSDEKQGLEA